MTKNETEADKIKQMQLEKEAAIERGEDTEDLTEKVEEECVKDRSAASMELAESTDRNAVSELHPGSDSADRHCVLRCWMPGGHPTMRKALCDELACAQGMSA